MVSSFHQVVILFATLFLVISCDNLRDNRVVKRNIPVDFHNGDIAFRRGVGMASQAVLMSNHRGSFSHVGIVTQIDSQWMVIHEVPYEGRSYDDDKIKCETIEEFFEADKAASGAIYRLHGLDSSMQNRICSYLFRQLELGLPFDHDYNLDDTTHQYCSELVWRSYLKAGVDLSEGRRTKVSMPLFSGEHIIPADIELNENLDIIHRF